MRRKINNIHITDADKQRLKQINLDTFIEEKLGLQCKARSAGKSSYLSPFRKEATPSFTVNYYQGEWHWKDWGGDPDNDHGDIITLVMRCYNVDFVEAVRMLFATNFAETYYRRNAESEELDKERKLAFLWKIYTRGLKLNDVSLVKKYFQDRHVNYHYPMGCVCINSFKEKKRYVAIPIPSPWVMKGLEMRELKGTSRKTFGEKTFWTLNRDPQKVLVTESVLDCLAGEKILADESISLWALNGVGNVDQIAEYLKTYNPQEIYVALDNDAPGQQARDKLVEIVSKTKTAIVFVEDHIRAGVKDLHKLITDSTNIKKAQGDDIS